MEERTASSDDILDDEVTDSDTEQQCNKHAVTDLLLRSFKCHKDESREYPDQSEVARTRYGNHQLIHERRVKIIVKSLKITKFELTKTTDLFVSLSLDLS